MARYRAALIIAAIVLIAGFALSRWRPDDPGGPPAPVEGDRADASGEPAVRNAGLDYALEAVFGEIEDATLAFEKALSRRDLEATCAALAEDAQVALPAAPRRIEPAPGELFGLEATRTPDVVATAGRAAAAGAFLSLLDGYRLVTDVRFKLKRFEGDAATATSARGSFYCEVRGELEDGTTVHDELRLDGAMAKSDGAWLLSEAKARERTLITGARRLFTEVTRAAGFECFSPEEMDAVGPFVPYHQDRTNISNLDYGGIAVGDADGDGRADVYVANAQGRNQLFMARGGGRFEDEADARGVRSHGGSRAGVFGDVDGDGDLDLFVTKATFHHRKAGPQSNQLFVNDGKGRFHDGTARAGLALATESMSATFLDYDRDGDLDLYVCCYGHMGLRPIDTYFGARNGHPNRLYRNRGDGTFEDVSAAARAGDTGWSYAVAAADQDGDGWPDLYVANDYGSNVLYRNRGDGTFDEVQDALGVADPGNGMGAAWSDVDGDLRLDLYVTNMSSATGRRILSAAPIERQGARDHLLKFTAGNSLFLSGGGGGPFAGAAERLGVAHCGWAWHADFFDADRDGFDDLYVANGYVTGVTDKDY